MKYVNYALEAEAYRMKRRHESIDLNFFEEQERWKLVCQVI